MMKLFDPRPVRLAANRKNIAKATAAITGIPHPWTKQPDNSKYLKNCIKERMRLKKVWQQLRNNGRSLASIGREFSVHRQRVWQVLTDYVLTPTKKEDR